MDSINKELEDSIKNGHFSEINELLIFIIKMMEDGFSLDQKNKELIVTKFNLKSIKELNEKIDNEWLIDNKKSFKPKYELKNYNNLDNSEQRFKKDISSILESYKIGFGILLFVNVSIIISALFFYNNVSLGNNIEEIKHYYNNYLYLSFILIFLNILGLFTLYKASNLKV